MSSVLIVTDEKELGTILAGKMEPRYGFQGILRSSGTEAISMLQILPIELIICREKIGAEFTAFKICEYLMTNKDDFEKEIPVLILGKSNMTGYAKAEAIPGSLSYEKILTYAGYLLGKEKSKPSIEVAVPPEPKAEEKTTVFVLPKGGLKAEAEKTPEAAKKPVVKFYPFHVRYLMHLPENIKVEFGIYTRMKKGDEFEYNLKVPAGNVLSKTDIEKLTMRTSKDLYVTKDEAAKASEFLNRFFMEKFRRTDLDIDKRLQINSDGFEILLESFKTSTFDKFSVEIIKEMVKSIDGLVKIPDALSHFKNFIVSHRLSYGYTHMHFTCLLIFSIVDQFDWGKEQSKNKIIYLSLFHDLCLGSDRLIKLHHKFFEQKNLSDEDKQAMLDHANASANILETIVKAPKELTSLVREHHGIKSGKGFADSRTISIASLSMAFIVAEDIVTHYLDLVEKLDASKEREPSRDALTVFFTELLKKYEKLAYADAARAYQKLFL